MQVFDYITEAQRRNDPLALERGLKWYLVLHDVLLRGARRTSRGGGRGTTYLAQRFDAWRRGDRLTLIRWLEADRARGWASARRRARVTCHVETDHTRATAAYPGRALGPLGGRYCGLCCMCVVGRGL